ncbi:hypothetical protein BOTBODRAFT_49703 [Botryobasidium botryosum FD-172 SS1]|uniref:Uncharacterized protein n=1 Tax=Botryobasidium botryosum (strain FD-172 SS1) TaxID=930990 RepID=A0A067M1P3_BOTB1|nr:hypothetical protein BOTBODRAFT_49703 [Botryobasidium botryosum FD-172 SS1]
MTRHARVRLPNPSRWCTCSRVCKGQPTLVPSTTFYRHLKLERAQSLAPGLGSQSAPEVDAYEALQSISDGDEEVSYDHEGGGSDTDVDMGDRAAPSDVPDPNALDLTIGDLEDQFRDLVLDQGVTAGNEGEEEDEADEAPVYRLPRSTPAASPPLLQLEMSLRASVASIAMMMMPTTTATTT